MPKREIGSSSESKLRRGVGQQRSADEELVVSATSVVDGGHGRDRCGLCAAETLAGARVTLGASPRLSCCPCGDGLKMSYYITKWHGGSPCRDFCTTCASPSRACPIWRACCPGMLSRAGAMWMCMLSCSHAPESSCRLGSLCAQKPAATKAYVSTNIAPFSQLLVPSCEGRAAPGPRVVGA